jgi:hypothetical protein
MLTAATELFRDRRLRATTTVGTLSCPLRGIVTSLAESRSAACRLRIAIHWGTPPDQEEKAFW